MWIGIETESAFDIVIGRIVSEKEKDVTNQYSKDGHTYDFSTSYAYGLDVQFSYKGQLKNRIEILGGKGLGDCGAIFEKGKEYLIVIHRGNRGYYTFLCSDNSSLANASSQINYLNKHFQKAYPSLDFRFLVLMVVLALLIALSSIIIVFKYYKHRSRRKNNWA
jgi:hypothetical protein